jgi:hypothetical protein
MPGHTSFFFLPGGYPGNGRRHSVSETPIASVFTNR